MNTLARVTMVIVCLAACIYGQRQLDARLRAASFASRPEPAPPLELVPHLLGRWCGEDETITAAEPKPTAGMQRLYFHADTGQAVRVTLRYDSAGGAKAPLPLVAGPAEPLTFHWYYALPTTDDPQLDLIARMYRRARVRPAYVAADVSVSAGDAIDPAAAADFVSFLDAALRQLLGPAAGRYGSFDTPIVAAGS